MATVTGRVLVCTRCAEPVRVYELPREFLDPARYVCGDCLIPIKDDPPQP